MPTPIYPPILSRQNFGSLVVDVTTEPALGNLSPIPDAAVIVKERLPSGETRIIAELTSNESGQTPSIDLPAPPEELSLTPLSPIIPYSTYAVEVQSPGFVTTQVDGNQIFPTIRSVLPVYLPPMRQRQHRQEARIIIIGPSTLLGTFPPKIPEAEVKDTSAPGFITLDEVVVPEFVIVHDGVPANVNATNYTVRFRDYVKNVASSEIYPTWPNQTILSNVIAIISFTLNRVYTEWYRNQGKNFTITNSTAFDHAFFYGRDIFGTISDVVDNYFDVYVKRPGVEQPLLTQYCDGAKSTCPNWLSQWGSKAFGDQGRNAEEILRYYYGENIEFPSAPTIEGVPESFPGSPLRLGDSGSDVRKIQEQLNRIAQNYPLIPTVRSSGDFDAATEEAVRTFQQIFHLPQTGVVDRATWYKISQIYVAVTKIGELTP